MHECGRLLTEALNSDWSTSIPLWSEDLTGSHSARGGLNTSMPETPTGRTQKVYISERSHAPGALAATEPRLR